MYVPHSLAVLRSFTLLCSVCAVLGCGGSNQTILPIDKPTPEQIAATQAEDAAIAEEEGAQQLVKKKRKAQ